MNRHALSAALIAALVVGAIDARAQAQTAGGSPEAEELFKQGRVALDATDYATACPKFAASLQLERAVGTLISLAECEERIGGLARARQHWQEAADLADGTNDRLNRGPFARQRFTQVDLRVPRLTLRLAANAPKETTVRRDDVTLGAAALGVPLPVDVGRHTITVTAPGRVSTTLDVSLAEGEQKALEVAPMEPIAAAVPMPTPAVDAAPQATPATPAAETPSNKSTQRTVAYVVGGVGIVGLALGSYFGLQTISKWSAARNDCPNGCADGSPGRNERNDAQTDGTISTIAFVAGGVALATGAVLFFTAPSSHSSSSAIRVRVTPTAERSGAGLLLYADW